MDICNLQNDIFYNVYVRFKNVQNSGKLTEFCTVRNAMLRFRIVRRYIYWYVAYLYVFEGTVPVLVLYERVV